MSANPRPPFYGSSRPSQFGSLEDTRSEPRISLPRRHTPLNYLPGSATQHNASVFDAPAVDTNLAGFPPTSSFIETPRPSYRQPDSIFLSQLQSSGHYGQCERRPDQFNPYQSGPIQPPRHFATIPPALTLRSNHEEFEPRTRQHQPMSGVDWRAQDHHFRNRQPSTQPAISISRGYQPSESSNNVQQSRTVSGGAHPAIMNVSRPSPVQEFPQASSSSSWPSDNQSSPIVQAEIRRRQRIHRPQAISPPTSSVAPRPTQLFKDVRASQQMPAVAHGIQLVSPGEALPDKFRAIFPYELFNAVQSKCFPSVYQSDHNLVVAAPTGSGKTVILELAICKLASARTSQNFKIIYQAPTKALCSERANDWEKKFNHMGLSVAELTGDTSSYELRRVAKASIIVTTPEKWDSVTRKWQDHRKLLELVELFLIDEVHILKESRGATLEAVVSRMKTIGANIRFVALSATVPNSEDIAKWLGRDHTNQQLPAQREVFGEELRPVRLKKVVCGYDCNGNDYIFDKFLDGKLPGVIAKHTQKKPMLIFCFTRKSCEATAANLADTWMADAAANKMWPAPKSRIAVVNSALQETVRAGVAFHHAGLDSDDRQAVQNNFLNGQIHVICCTSTLAVGVNLPCHTVILKGTTGFQDGQMKELSDLEIMQMLGRAGRPQFDDSALAIILTRNRNREKYEQMVSGEDILESTLHLNLIEHLNSEILLGTITNLATAKEWLRGTFLSIRLRRNPAHYKLTANTPETEHIDAKLEEICERDIRMLQETKLVTDGLSLKWTNYGKAMSTYMVPFKTMRLILGLPKGAKMEELINTLAKAESFNEIRFQPDERAIFREINTSPFILYPIRETVTQTWHKISLIVQKCLGGVDLTNEPAAQRRRMLAEQKSVLDSMKRFARCYVECKGADNDAVGLRIGIELTRALAAEAWEGRPTQLLQITGVGPVAMRKFVSSDVRTVIQLAESDSGTIERIMSRNPPYGSKLLMDLSKFPRLTVDASIVGQNLPRDGEPGRISVKINAELGLENSVDGSKFCAKHPCVTFMAETGDGELAYFWRGRIKQVEQQKNHEHRFTAKLVSSPEIICHFSCDEIVGTIVSTRITYDGPWLERLAEPVVSSQDDDAPKQSGQQEQPEEEFEGDSMEFPEDIDQLLAVGWTGTTRCDETEVEESEPIRLPNGNWKCNHQCSGGAPTKSGKKCTHRCCVDGVKVRRKKSVSKSTTAKSNPDQEKSAAPSSRSPIRRHFQAEKAGPSQRKRKEETKDARPTAIPDSPRRKRAKLLDELDWDSDSDIIDLTGIDESKDPSTLQAATKRDASRRKDEPSLTSGDSFGEIFNELADGSIPSAETRATIAAPLTPFKPGASDEVLYDGISSGFPSSESKAVLPKSKQDKFVGDQDFSEQLRLNDDDDPHYSEEQEGSSKVESPETTGEPAWVAEFARLHPDIMEEIRGVAHFV